MDQQQKRIMKGVHVKAFNHLEGKKEKGTKGIMKGSIEIKASKKHNDLKSKCI